MTWEERTLKWCLMNNREFGTEITVPKSVKEHVLHWSMPQGIVPLGTEQFCCKELCILDIFIAQK